MLKLPQITLCAFGSEKYRDVQQKALDYSCRGIEWGAVKNIIEPCDGMEDWCKKVIYDLPKHIETDYCMLIHPDGFVVNPESWRDEFLEYDYIGAPWPPPQDNFSYRDINGEIVQVGNSVSLRSKRLLDLANDLKIEWKPFHGFYNEDGFISVNYRHIYEQHGMKFSPLEVAKYFSHETMIPEIEGITPFAFHKHQGTNAHYPNFEEEV